MIRLLLLLALLVTGLILGPYLIGQKGYVLIAMDTLTIETSVVFLGFVLFAMIVGFLILEWLVKLVSGSFVGTKTWFGEFGLRKKQRAFNAGLQAIVEGDYAYASKQLQKIQEEDFDGVNLLAQAEAELRLNNRTQARELWQQATQFNGACVAATIMLTKDSLNQQQPAQAIKLIEQLNEKQQKRKTVLNLWAQALAQSGQWQRLKSNLSGWKKTLGEDYQYWMNQASQGAFSEIASKEGANQLKRNWQTLPRSSRKDPAQRTAYIQQLLDQGMHQDAEQALVEYQQAGPEPLLLPLYKQLQLPNPAAAIRQLETWLKQHDTDSQLYSALGHLAFNSGDMSLAEKALGRAIALGQQQQDILQMAALKERQQDNVSALKLYKQGMQIEQA